MTKIHREGTVVTKKVLARRWPGQPDVYAEKVYYCRSAQEARETEAHLRRSSHTMH
jgi:hypothetical protein